MVHDCFIGFLFLFCRHSWNKMLYLKVNCPWSIMMIMEAKTTKKQIKPMVSSWISPTDHRQSLSRTNRSTNTKTSFQIFFSLKFQTFFQRDHHHHHEKFAFELDLHWKWLSLLTKNIPRSEKRKKRRKLD